MTIGFDIRAIIGKPLFGNKAPAGVAGYVIRLLHELLAIDTTNDYILFANAFKKPDTSLLKNVLNKPNVHSVTTRIPNKFFDPLAKYNNAPYIDKIITKKTGAQIDVYLTPHINITPLSSHIPHIVIVHDVSFEIYPEFYGMRKQYWHYLQNVPKTCQRASRVIAVSGNTRRDLITLYNLDPEKVITIYPGADTERLESSLMFKDVQEKFGIPYEYVLYMGTLEPRKNVESLVEAFDIFKKKTSSLARLVLVGGKGWLASRISAAIRHAQYRKDIHLLGYVSAAEKTLLLRHARVFVFPSFYEGFGFPPLEALASGIPVIASSAASLPEVVGTRGYYVNPYNVYDIALAMRSALLQAPLHNSYSKQTSQFDWVETAYQTLDVISRASVK